VKTRVRSRAHPYLRVTANEKGARVAIDYGRLANLNTDLVDISLCQVKCIKR